MYRIEKRQRGIRKKNNQRKCMQKIYRSLSGRFKVMDGLGRPVRERAR